MKELQTAVALVEKLGGQFVAEVADVSRRLARTKALIFDWDGVFNDGSKGEGHASTYNEGDTAGINMLRFAVWLETGQLLPVFIVSGQHNKSAVQLAKRDKFTAAYFRMANKATAVKHIAQQLGCKTGDLFCMYDDTIDLSMAALCGLRVLVNRPAAAVFQQFVAEKELADYITGNTPGNNPVREAMDLCLLLTGQADKALTLRTNNDKRFFDYTRARAQMAYWGAFSEAEGQIASFEG